MSEVHTVQRVERHLIKKTSKDFKVLDELCFNAKNLYNFTNYICRQAFAGHKELIPEYEDLITKERFISEYDLVKRFASQNQQDYRSMVSAWSAQQVVYQVFENWKSWFKALKAYKRNPSSFTGCPKMPGYKDKKNGRSMLVVGKTKPNKDGSISLSKTLKLKIRTKLKSFQQIRVIHKGYYIMVEIVYKKELNFAENENADSLMSIDLGVNNLASITSDNGMSYIVNGRNLKSINQFYNKKLAKLQQVYSKQKIKTGSARKRLELKRKNKIDDYLHKASLLISELAVKNQIKYVVVGLNKGWKNEPKMSKTNKQNFIQIPFDRFISMLRYKLEERNIKLVMSEESFTSKCSFLDDEEICFHQKYKGQRIKRGLFKSGTGKCLNADINGSLNILRKLDLGKIEVFEKIFRPTKVKDIERNLVSLRVNNSLITSRG